MKLRTLMGAIDEAERAGDLRDTSPVFAVVRNESAPLHSGQAWNAISVVGIAARDGGIVLAADASEDAKDMTVAALRERVRRLPGASLEHRAFVTVASGESDANNLVPVVEAYGDEHGLGLMVHFEGYEAWLRTQS
jgi:hypothetical protein